MKIYQQSEASECGLACLAMISSHYGNYVELTQLRRQFHISLKGATLAQLIRHASVLNLSARPMRLELEEISALRLPCILHWNLGHFVVLKKVNSRARSVIIVDPSRGERRLSLDEVSRHFTGVALELTPSEKFTATEPPRRISLSDLAGKVHGLRSAIAQVLMLSLALEAFAICAPMFNQFVIDEVIVSGDNDMLTVMAIGFGLLIAIQTLISIARSWFVMRWSMDVSFQWGGRVFSHLTNLPLSFFQKRHLGDITSRFGSTAAIQSTLTSLYLESGLDALTLLATGAMMFAYSPKLASLAITGVVMYSVIRIISYHPFRQASQERLILTAREQSYFLKTIRAISPIKLFNREDERRSRWLNLKIDVQNRDIKTQKMAIFFKLAVTTLSSLQVLAIFYYGGGFVISGALTVGMLMAFMSYATTFSSRAYSLIDSFVNFRMLSLHCERLADIVLEHAEDDVGVQQVDFNTSPVIEVRNLSFRYADGEPWVLKNVNLTIAPKENVAFIGPSGCGKSTLLKILLGTLTPTEGDIYFDGISQKKIGVRKCREFIGAVSQDDVLVSGTILDNISFFDPNFDIDFARECARKSELHEDIMAMPMTYQTLVGDMGNSLSGGQKQRLLLARAIYKRPLVLALDEATSHLDTENEVKINASLNAVGITKVVVAHRKETIECADRIFRYESGNFVEVVKVTRAFDAIAPAPVPMSA
jgi:ATP-binding cassette, subfamily B, bacterial CvaB/MchF/RaxB